jgi:hypothetical protein
MPAVVVLSELEDVGAKLGADEPLSETDPVIRKMMSGPA